MTFLKMKIGKNTEIRDHNIEPRYKSDASHIYICTWIREANADPKVEVFSEAWQAMELLNKTRIGSEKGCYVKMSTSKMSTVQMSAVKMSAVKMLTVNVLTVKMSTVLCNVNCQSVGCQNVDCQNVDYQNVDCQNVDCRFSKCRLLDLKPQ
jgi:hypothetical protein